jgi:hypothetical protein
MAALSNLLSLVLLRSADLDLETLLKWLAAFAFFIGAPLIKRIFQSQEKARSDAQSAERRSARDKEREGRRAFEDLLRGGTTLAPPPVLEARPPEASEAPIAVGDARATTRIPRRAPVSSKPLVEMTEVEESALTGPEFEAEEAATDEEIVARTEGREREELQHQRVEQRVPEEIARREYAAASSLRENVEPVPVEALRSPSEPAPSGAPLLTCSQRLLGSTGGSDRRAVLRRALILNEVLGVPVAERDSSDPRAPLGLRA